MIPILFYSPYCNICPGVITRAVEYFNQKGITLMIRMPTAKDKTYVKGVPALFVPKELGAFDASYLLIGEQIPDWLHNMTDKIKCR